MEAILPTSANWYCSRIIDGNEQGIVCIGAKNSVDVWQVSSISAAQHIATIRAHEERVVGISICHQQPHSSDFELPTCCSVGEDGKVRVWNLNSKELVKEHSSHKNKLTTVHWSQYGSCRFIASGDDKGFVFVWNVLSDEISSWQPESVHKHVFCLSFPQTMDNILAVGFKTGAIALLDVSKKNPTIVQRLRGHDDEVHCLCWSPGQHTSSTDESDAGLVLASSCRDKTVRLWNWKKGQTLSTLKLPSSGANSGRQRSDEHGAKSRVWTAMCWPSHNQLVTSGLSGELLLWNLSDIQKPKWQAVTGAGSRGHTRVVFCIAMSGNDGSVLTTVSMDRQMIVWDLSNLSMKQAIPSLGGFVYALSTSPVHPDRVAVGSGDCLIRVWNLSVSTSLYNIQTYWQGIKAKVTALSWHPVKEWCLAYGTEDGRVGAMDVVSTTRSPIISETYHQKTVYILTWGPDCSTVDIDQDQRAAGIDHVLYSVGDGIILQHNMNKPSETAVNFDVILQAAGNAVSHQRLRTCMAWTQDWSHVAIGNEDGEFSQVNFDDSSYKTLTQNDINSCIELIDITWFSCDGIFADVSRVKISYLQYDGTWLNYAKELILCRSKKSIDIYQSKPLQLVCKLIVNKKLINCLNWHPRHTLESDTNLSSCNLWLAVGSNESVVHAFDLCKPLTSQGKSPVIISESSRQLIGHCNRVTGLSWSQHNDGFLATASYDWTSQVWNVKLGSIIALYTGHVGRLFCVEWSAVNSDVIFTGSDDHTVHLWNISRHSCTSIDKKAIKNKVSNTKSKKPCGRVVDLSTKTNRVVVDCSNTSPAGEGLSQPTDGGGVVNVLQAAACDSLSQTDLEELQKLLNDKRTQLMTPPKNAQPQTDSPQNTSEDNAAATAVGVAIAADRFRLNQTARVNDSSYDLTCQGTDVSDVGESSDVLVDKTKKIESFQSDITNVWDGRLGEDSSEHPVIGRRDTVQGQNLNYQRAVAADDDDGVQPLEVDTGSDESEEETSRPMNPVKVASVKDDANEKKKRRAKSLFPKSSIAENRGKQFTQQDCVELAKVLHQTESKCLPDHLSHVGCFVDRRNTYLMYRQEEQYHIEHGNIDQYITLQVFKGRNISQVFDKICADSVVPLNDYYLLLANDASAYNNKLLYENYAKQLESDGHYHKSATIYLTVYDVHQAIDVLANNGLYKDALCLARVRLHHSDPVITRLLTKWAAQLIRDGSYELSAKCYLALGNVPEAASCLVKRTELNGHRCAIAILVTANELDLATIYVQKFVSDCLQNFEWTSLQEIVRLSPTFSVFSIMATSYQYLLDSLSHTHSLQTVLTGRDASKSVHRSSDVTEGEQFCFFTGLIESLSKSKIDLANRELLQNYFVQLEKVQYTKQSQSSVLKVLEEASLYLSLCLLQLLQHNIQAADSFLTKAVRCCLNAQHFDLAFEICQRTVPQGFGCAINKLHEVGHELMKRAMDTANLPVSCDPAISDSEIEITEIIAGIRVVQSFDTYYALATVKFYVSLVQQQRNGICRNEINIFEQLSLDHLVCLCRALLSEYPIHTGQLYPDQIISARRLTEVCEKVISAAESNSSEQIEPVMEHVRQWLTKSQ